MIYEFEKLAEGVLDKLNSTIEFKPKGYEYFCFMDKVKDYDFETWVECNVDPKDKINNLWQPIGNLEWGSNFGDLVKRCPDILLRLRVVVYKSGKAKIKIYGSSVEVKRPYKYTVIRGDHVRP